MARPVESESQPESLFLVYVNQDESEDEYVEAELEGLCEAVGGVVAGSVRQRLKRPDRATYIGKGKVEEIKAYVADTGADAVVIDSELSGAQLRNLEEEIGKRVLDRTQLILDIFALRASTREGQLQVELAQLTYRLPRLMSVYTEFERQRGGIGMRGPGETKLEADRRTVKKRISKLKAEIDDVKRHRAQQRSARSKQPFPTVAIIGYTSSGKSTLMNRLTGTDVLVDAMPFATLDPTTRKVDLPDGFSFFLVDTVGFIRNLPTQLVAAFRATLEEVVEADLLLHVIDATIPDWELQRDTVIETVENLGAGELPVVTVFNKIDALKEPSVASALVCDWPDSVAISALTGVGVNDLMAAIARATKKGMELVRALVPYDQNALVEACYRFGRVIKKDYRDEGIYLEAELVPEMYAKIAKYEIP
ncbi:MAG: GTPase HflX [Armatimonadetes bacterium]|nr:GTPase HflX [Armatimonadota bacterium]